MRYFFKIEYRTKTTADNIDRERERRRERQTVISTDRQIERNYIQQNLVWKQLKGKVTRRKKVENRHKKKEWNVRDSLAREDINLNLEFHTSCI